MVYVLMLRTFATLSLILEHPFSSTLGYALHLGCMEFPGIPTHPLLEIQNQGFDVQPHPCFYFQ